MTIPRGGATLSLHLDRNEEILLPAFAPKVPVVEPRTPPRDPLPPHALAQSESPDARPRVPRRKRDTRDEEFLRMELSRVPEVDLDATPGTSLELSRSARTLTKNKMTYPGPLAIRDERADLTSLLLNSGTDCQLTKESATTLQDLSLKLRKEVESCRPRTGADRDPDPERLRQSLSRGGAREWRKDDAVPALRQILEAEATPVRLVLVDLLADIPGKRAAEALAVRALVDVSPKVREAATEALRTRPTEDYLDKVLAGLKYPWVPVADHAAELLVNLECRQAVPRVAQMLNERDPAAPQPFVQGRLRGYAVAELVRVNHLRNCVLCHAPSFGEDDLVRGGVPRTNKALPTPSPDRPSGYSGKADLIVRADVTYLRQDFSVVQQVANPGPWPASQRYDYLVRLRLLSDMEAEQLREGLKSGQVSGQRQAMMFALRELTGLDLGSTPEAWRPLMEDTIKAGKSFEAAQCQQDVLSGSSERQAAALTRLREAPGVAFTNTLAEVIPVLTGAARQTAREALLERLNRMTTGTVRGKSTDQNAEVRRCAAVVCGLRKDTDLIPELIVLLEDPDLTVAEAAHEALKRLAGTDLRVVLGRSGADQHAAAKQWIRWWRGRQGL